MVADGAELTLAHCCPRILGVTRDFDLMKRIVDRGPGSSPVRRRAAKDRPSAKSFLGIFPAGSILHANRLPNAPQCALSTVYSEG